MTKIVEGESLRERTNVFGDRFHAGELLAEKLKDLRGEDALVLAIPAGGVPVGITVARRLALPFDVIMVRKLHIPWNREAGFGAIAWDGTVRLNEPLVKRLGLSGQEIDECIAEERGDIEKRLRLFRGEAPFLNIEGKIAILVDDGLASGFTMLAAVRSVGHRGVSKIVVAAPTASMGAIGLLRPHVDTIVCLNIRTGPTFAVADAYKLWHDLDDEEVMEILKTWVKSFRAS
ncbi:MAG: phosphoribosyltransferase [Candidatus Bathyarchaeia archaeon]